MSNIPTAVPR